LNNTREVRADSSVENPESTHELLGALTTELTALMGLHLLYKVYEWTVEGSSWLAHRCLAIDLGCAVAKSIDLVADRIVGLGGIPVPDLSDQTFRSQWKAGSIVPPPQEMLAASLRAERKIVEKLDEHRKLARGHQDYLTDDVLSHLHTKHARHIEDLLSAKVEGLDPHNRRPE
jgi:DNA-binding ferritin-like protein